jgi:gas vesicle protein
MALETGMSIATLIGVGATLFGVVVQGLRAAKRQGQFEQEVKDEIKAVNVKADDIRADVTKIKDQKIKDEIIVIQEQTNSIKADINEIKEIINKDGIVQKITDLTTNCGSKMANVEATIEAHMKLPGHGEMPQKMAKLETEVDHLKNKRLI